MVTMSYRMDHTYIREFNKDAGEFQVSSNIDFKLKKIYFKHLYVFSFLKY